MSAISRGQKTFACPPPLIITKQMIAGSKPLRGEPGADLRLPKVRRWAPESKTTGRNPWPTTPGTIWFDVLYFLRIRTWRTSKKTWRFLHVISWLRAATASAAQQSRNPVFSGGFAASVPGFAKGRRQFHESSAPWQDQLHTKHPSNSHIIDYTTLSHHFMNNIAGYWSVIYFSLLRLYFINSRLSPSKPYCNISMYIAVCLFYIIDWIRIYLHTLLHYLWQLDYIAEWFCKCKKILAKVIFFGGNQIYVWFMILFMR